MGFAGFAGLGADLGRRDACATVSKGEIDIWIEGDRAPRVLVLQQHYASEAAEGRAACTTQVAGGCGNLAR